MSRPGKKWEAAGFVAIAGGMVLVAAAAPESAARSLGALACMVGFVVFLVGRFK